MSSSNSNNLASILQVSNGRTLERRLVACGVLFDLDGHTNKVQDVHASKEVGDEKEKN